MTARALRELLERVEEKEEAEEAQAARRRGPQLDTVFSHSTLGKVPRTHPAERNAGCRSSLLS